MNKRVWGVVLAVALSAGLVAQGACQGTVELIAGRPLGGGGSGVGGDGGTHPTTTSTGDGAGGDCWGDFCVDAGPGGYDGGDPCVDLVVDPEFVMVPADVIVVVDNSPSMVSHIDALEAHLGDSLAAPLDDAELDSRFIVISDHGPGGQQLCVGPPLGTGNCNGAPDEIADQLYPYDVTVGGHDSACVILDTLLGPSGGGEADEHGMYPNGWSAALRPEALKAFVQVTDDGIYCNWKGTQLSDGDQVGPGQTFATTFDPLLRQQAPTQFGTNEERNYQFNAIIGLPAKSTPIEPYQPSEPVALGTCQGGVAPGTGYQWLAKGTEGLRLPICQGVGPTYDGALQRVAEGIIDGATLECEIVVPEIPDTQEPNPDYITIYYTPPGGTTVTEEFYQVAGEQLCGTGDDRFYREGDRFIFCPALCERITNETGEKLEVKLPCPCHCY